MNTDITKKFAEIEEVIRGTIPIIKLPNQTVYAAGFWLFYSDETKLAAPAFSYNTNEHPSRNDYKWSPPEWHQSADPIMAAAMVPIYKDISGLVKGKSSVFWDLLMEFQFQFYSELCKKLMLDNTFKDWRKTDDFIVGIFEERDGDELFKRLVASSINGAVVEKLGILKCG